MFDSREKFIKSQTDLFFGRDFHGEKVALSFFFFPLHYVRHLFCLQSSFSLPSPTVLELESKCPCQILALLSSPPTCTSKMLSSRNVTEEILLHIYSYVWPTRNFWTSVALLGTGGYWAALQSAVNPPGCTDGNVTSPGPWFRKLVQYIVLQWMLGELCFQSCTLERAGKLPPGCTDTYSRSFWESG